MTFDWTIRVTDILMIAALLLGPVLAVQITEHLRKSEDTRKRKVNVFRTLMATRSAPLSAAHIEALNLVEVEFQTSRKAPNRRVVESWKIYLAHLNDLNYPRETWITRRTELLVDLLYDISSSLGYSYEKSQIRAGTYYPAAWQQAENEQAEIRKLLLATLQGQRPLQIQTSPPPPASPAPPATPTASP